ncbi:MAG: Serine/threonine exchanger SteT [Syntrophus sp. PtaB.Bin001]|nr:MAG: Serine/threonine exchanger SteT [Syntrophus sp. PtaB.Bin001]
MKLKGNLSLFDAVLLIIGNVIGAGIFTTSGFLAGELPHPWLFIGIWILGGLLTICGALTYAEMAGMYPLAGGDYHFLKAAYGKWAGFLLGWVSFWVIGPGSIAALAIALASYLNPLFQIDGGTADKLVAILIIFSFAIVNYHGIRPGGTLQDFFSLGTVAILSVMILGGFFFGKGHWHHFIPMSSGQTNVADLFASPMIAVIFTYSGWFAAAYIGSEIKNPGRNLPISLFLGTLVVAAFYTAINVLYLYAAPIEKLAGNVNVAQFALQNLFNPTIAGAVSIPIMLAIAASISATVLTGPRIYYAMAEDRVFWRRLKELHPRYRTPHIAIVSQAIIACILVVVGTFDQLLSYVVFVMLLSSLASGIAIFILRRRYPEHYRPYRTWGYPIIPLIFISFYACIAFQIFYSKPFITMLGIMITLTGLPFYMWWQARSKKE